MKIPALISNVSSPVDLGGRQEAALEFFTTFPDGSGTVGLQNTLRKNCRSAYS